MEQELKKKKKYSKKLIIIVICLLLICAGSFGYMKYKESSARKSNEEKEKIPPKKETEINNSLTEEEKIKEDLSEKINTIITSGRDTEGITIDNNTYFSLSMLEGYDLLTNNNLTEEDKIIIALNSGEHTDLTIPIDDIGIDRVKEGIEGGILYQQITAEEAQKQYNKLFSEKIIANKEYGNCPRYLYDEKNKVYYINRECGSSSVEGIYVYKSDFQKLDEETISVLVTLAYSFQITGNSSNVYKDIQGYTLAKSNPENEYLFAKAVENRDDYSYIANFQISEENKHQLKNYIFQFKKDENANYYLYTITSEGL